jgi:predicted  nucleic acid-binding Zn-ribbon protein
MERTMSVALPAWEETGKHGGLSSKEWASLEGEITAIQKEKDELVQKITEVEKFEETMLEDIKESLKPEHLELARRRLSTFSTSEELLDAAKLGSTSILSQILQSKVNVNFTDDCGFTALHWYIIIYCVGN